MSSRWLSVEAIAAQLDITRPASDGGRSHAPITSSMQGKEHSHVGRS